METKEELKEYQRLINLEAKISNLAQKIEEMVTELADEVGKAVPSWAWENRLEDMSDEDLDLFILEASLEQDNG